MSQSAAKEAPCPDCGEMVRVNSLRCWNCGAFMNAELEQRYMAMQANPAPTIFSEVPASEISSMDDVGTDDDDDDGGFSLHAGVQSTRSTMSPPIAPASAPATPEVVEDEENDDFPGGPVETPPAGPSSGETPRQPSAPESALPHSVATGGDALLDIAMQEERELKKRSKGKRLAGPVKTAGGGLIIYCPYGCRVEVKEQHRGMTGRCPRCAAPFIVPIDPPQYRKSEATTGEKTAVSTSSEKLQVWISDLHLHVVEPEKLKLKADSLLKDFVEADIGFAPEYLVVAVLAKKGGGGGLFAKGGEKKGTVRENMIAHLKEQKPIADLPVAEKYVFTSEEVSEIRVVQPAENRGTSLFHGIPVFGTGRIAIQLPLNDQLVRPTYVSMGITEFWTFAKALEETYGLTGLGLPEGIPMEPKITVSKCHFSDMPIKSLENVKLFQADPTVQLEVIGYRCGACKTTVSEPARKKENLGGKSPKGIAKAKCPKCGSKMGEHLLYALKQDVVEQGINDSAGS